MSDTLTHNPNKDEPSGERAPTGFPESSVDILPDQKVGEQNFRDVWLERGGPTTRHIAEVLAEAEGLEVAERQERGEAALDFLVGVVAAQSSAVRSTERQTTLPTRMDVHDTFRHIAELAEAANAGDDPRVAWQEALASVPEKDGLRYAVGVLAHSDITRPMLAGLTGRLGVVEGERGPHLALTTLNQLDSYVDALDPGGQSNNWRRPFKDSNRYAVLDDREPEWATSYAHSRDHSNRWPSHIGDADRARADLELMKRSVDFMRTQARHRRQLAASALNTQSSN